MFLARSFLVSLQLVVKANSCSSDNNRMPENPSAACPMRNRLSLYVDYCRAFCALAKNFVLVMANSCSSGSNRTLENPSAASPTPSRLLLPLWRIPAPRRISSYETQSPVAAARESAAW